MGDWSELLPDMLVEIARRIQMVEDFVAFGGVCTTWRAAAKKENFSKSFPQIPLLMLAEKKESDDREFFSLFRNKIWRKLWLPETKGKKCMESKGWLITLGESGEMNLFNPFSRVQIELPNQTTFPEYEDFETSSCFTFSHRAVLSASPSDTSDFVLMVVHCGGLYLGYWRPGDKSWTRIESQDYRWGSFSDVNYYNGKFYAISFGGSLWVCDVSVSVSGPDPDYTFEHVFNLRMHIPGFFYGQAYLVESLSGELLIVVRDGVELDDDGISYGVEKFQLFQLDLIKLGCKEISSLGETAIFVGHNSAISIDASRFSDLIKPNCIFFTDDSMLAYLFTQQGGGKDMGVYHIEDGKIERFPDFQSFSFVGPPIWILPSL